MKTIKNQKIEGVITALVTPFKKGRVDYKSLKKLVRQQLDSGVSGFVVSGTTGESPTLREDEVEKIFKFVKKESDSSVPLLIGTGTNNTLSTVEKTKKAKALGADAALVVVPYYNKPPQKGLYEHFKFISSKVKIPIVLYNVPGRTITSLSVETTTKLSKIINIVGIKEASGDMDMMEQMKSIQMKSSQIKSSQIKSNSKKSFIFLSGDDSSCIDFNTRGGHGVISVISHIIPKELSELVSRTCKGDKSASFEYSKYEKLNQLMGIEPNPIPVKMGLYIMGIIDSPELRLPLVELSSEYKKTLKSELKKLGIV